VSIIVELELDPASFELGRTVPVGEETRVELETTVPSGEQTLPLLWIAGEDRGGYRSRLADCDRVQSVERVVRQRRRSLFRVAWDSEPDRFVETVIDNDGEILHAVGTVDGWEFEIEFPDADRRTAFRGAIEAAEFEIDDRQLYEPVESTGRYGLTDPQQEVLELAAERGYFEIPRQTSLHGLAEELDLSDQAVSERLRRGTRRLTEETLLAPDGRE